MIFRPRRLRRTAAIRDLVAETDVRARHLIQPYFVTAQPGSSDIASLPGIQRTDLEATCRQVEADLKLGLRSVLLFGVPDHKSPAAEHSHDPSGIVPVVTKELKARFGADLIVMTDVCLCAYTDHGHCGVVRDGEVLNDESLPLIAGMALAHAAAGADIVAPSDMMDGRVGAIRQTLDLNGLSGTPIMSYSAKYASGYYGPFREAADSAPAFGDRRSYQMDPRNAREAVREVLLDVDEGADIVMVKPALAYLDVIRRVREQVTLPVACYNVSGEYSMVKAAARAGWVDEPRVVRENLWGMARAGADIIITYHGRDALREGWL